MLTCIRTLQLKTKKKKKGFPPFHYSNFRWIPVSFQKWLLVSIMFSMVSYVCHSSTYNIADMKRKFKMWYKLLKGVTMWKYWVKVYCKWRAFTHMHTPTQIIYNQEWQRGLGIQKINGIYVLLCFKDAAERPLSSLSQVSILNMELNTVLLLIFIHVVFINHGVSLAIMNTEYLLWVFKDQRFADYL